MALIRTNPVSGSSVADTINVVGTSSSNQISVSGLSVGDTILVICNGASYTLTSVTGATLLDEETQVASSTTFKMFMYKITGTTFTATTNGDAVEVIKINS